MERRRKTDWAVFGAYLAGVVALAIFASTRRHGASAVIGGAHLIGLTGAAAAHTAVLFRRSPGENSGLSAGVWQHGNDRAIEAARHRMARRKQARELTRSDPALAWELRIGRPDLPRDYDDGGLVDINHVPADVLAGQLGLALDEVTALVAALDRLGAFSSTEELVAYEALSPDRAEELRNLLIFVLR